ncbi:hypothetical protein PLICRDRAFT_169348 [Plicaturopsis crispa FD-325 SS-3]|nr:hypothetical protein PLICRDRAFT_169348 [Plicaturopsis crispa FD-325 SS-3]
MSNPPFRPRRAHRKRISTSRLSSDTVTTLPEYTSPPWNTRQHVVELDEDTPSDRPPDYPETDSAEEGDADTDDEDEHTQTVYVPQRVASSPFPAASLPTSPRRTRRFPQTHRRQSASTPGPSLDSLLARSVHALEMSNALLQTSLSPPPIPDDTDEYATETSARGLSRRTSNGSGLGIRRFAEYEPRQTQENWMDHIDEISRDVDLLFGESDAGVSRSLPTTSSMHAVRRRPSRNPDSTPALRLSNVDRSALIAPPPRALTQYVESGADPASIFLPSTLGLRASSSSHSSDVWPSPELPSSSRRIGFHAAASASLPVLTDRPSEPSTPAYNLLSSFVKRPSSSVSPSLSRSSSITSPSISSFFSRRRRGSNSTERPAIGTHTSPTRGRSSSSRSRSLTPTQRPCSSHTLPRPMTPPIEELSSSSDSSAHPTGYRTVQSLRKILDEQPAPPAPPPIPRPRFMPRTPLPAATSDTTTTTASVSRLYTRAKHHSSTRAPSPPKHSSMKRSRPSTPATPVGELFPSGQASQRTSGRSTPKRISFAALPESYASSRPGSSRRKNKSRDGKKDRDRDKEGVGGGWFSSWLLGAAAVGGGPAVPSSAGAHHEERVEERIGRSWGGRTGMGAGLDDWAV